MNRRKFIQNTVASSALLGSSLRAVAKPKIEMETVIMATNWGFQGSLDEFCKKAKKEGYDGIEVWYPNDPKEQNELFEALQKHELQLGYLTAGHDAGFQNHFNQFKENVSGAAGNLGQKPLYINCHSGKDYFSFEENKQIIEFAQNVAEKSGLEIIHETHRGRMCFATTATRSFLTKYPKMGLTLDISHWCNVHESLLEDQPEAVELALSRARHIHLRVGHQESPQVNDPRAPEWKSTLEAHLNWWDKVRAYREKSGAKRMTYLAEFGPSYYMPALPYTQQPVADQWDINVYMMKLIRERYS